MNFTEVQNVTRNGDASTKIGTCSDGGDQFKCVEKIYGERSFDRVKQILEEFSGEIEELGPQIRMVHEATKTVYMEYIECDTLEKYLHQFDMLNDYDHEKLSVLFASLNTFCKRLRELDLCHGDLHTENILVCTADMTLKMIDIDTLSRTAVQGWCDDDNILGTTIYRALTKSIRENKKESLKEAKSRIEEEYRERCEKVMMAIDEHEVDDDLRKNMALVVG